jgi:nucleotide-binding universal stress UspA family protein
MSGLENDMFRHIVVPLDGSEFAAHALPIGMQLAAAAGVSVRVVGVANTDAELAWTYDHVVADAQRAGVGVADVDVRVDPDPAGVLLAIAADASNVVCLASHARPKPAATLMHSVGSRVIARAPNPVVIVGRNASTAWPGSDVVVALDGVSDPQPLLDAGLVWAHQLQSSLRFVTVYEPVLAEVGDPTLYVRGWGTSYDPHVYLDALSERVDQTELAGLELVAIRDEVGAARGLERHLAQRPACLLVVGADRAPARVAGELLRTSPVPLLMVNAHR